MPRIVLKCPYLKGGSERASSHLSNLVTYMATRSGVEKMAKGIENIPSSMKQEDLIKQIIKEFPSSKNLFEYEDYLKNKTTENASEFISIALEQNIDKIGKRKNYVDYIANRPRVERMGTHGLFTGGDDEIVLNKIAEEVANHTGNVWVPIISLRREDAIRTGFDKVEAWHNMLSYFAPQIAESMKIPIQNFRWYAAFHNESHHPHVHMICYSVNPADGYLTKKGIENMKSGLIKNIFKNEMEIIYAEQTQRRENLKSESKEILKKLILEMKSGTINNPKIEELLLQLSEKLKHTKGKKVYGYLQPNIKAIVDEIVDELSKEEVVAKAYELWYEMREEVLHSYMDEIHNRIPLSQQKEFKSIKNMIITEADKLSQGAVEFEEIEDAESAELSGEIDEVVEIIDFNKDETFNNTDYEPITNQENDERESWNQNLYVKWTYEYKQARKYLNGTNELPQNFDEALMLLLAEAKKGNTLAIYDLGRIYSYGLGVEKNHELANEYYRKALAGFKEIESNKAWEYLEYRIGKMYAAGIGTEQDYKEAAKWLGISSEKEYMYAQYSLGALYQRGYGVEQNFQTAFGLYIKSANKGFPYANFEVAKMYRDGVGTDRDETKSIEHFKKAFYGFERLENTSHDDKIQYRLGWMLQNGIGTQKDIPRAKSYYEKSVKQGNTHAGYELAKHILLEDNPSPEDVQNAIKYLKSVAENDGVDFNLIRPLAYYTLGKVFIEGKVVPKNVEEAVLFLTKSAEENNHWASYRLGKLFLEGIEVKKDVAKAIDYLLNSAEQANQFAQYILGKAYLLGKDVTRDKDLANDWLTKSAEQENEYAKFLLENLDKFKEPSVAICVSRLLNYMSRIFEENVMSHRQGDGLKVDSKLLKKLKEKKVVQGHKRGEHGFEM